MTAALLALLGAGVAQAHDDATLDKTKAPNGGQLRMAGAYHFELVLARDGDAAAARPVMVHVTDHAGTAVDTAGATGTITLLAGQTRSSMPLAPAGGNRMKGMARYPSTPELKAVVSITLRGKSAEQARFTPF